MPVPAPSPDARAVVTGASQGIGEALATELAAKVERLEREMKAYKAHKPNPLQGDLLEQA